MKRLSKNYQIVITVNIEYVFDEKAASIYLQKMDNISKNNQINEEILVKLNDLISSIISHINYYKFDLKRHYPGSKGYSYYVKFAPLNKNGKPFSDVDLLFRVSDHNSKTLINSNKILVKSFIINNKTVNNSMQMLQELDKIFDELSKGNFDVLN